MQARFGYPAELLNITNASPSIVSAQPAGLFRVTHHPAELAISFQGGAGVTRSVSREYVWFVTDHPPDPEQMIEGTLRTSGGHDGLVARLRYRARVVAVRKPGDGGAWEAEARFEDLGFATPGAA